MLEQIDLHIFKPGARRSAPAHAWFLKIVTVWTSICVCAVFAPKAINN